MDREEYLALFELVKESVARLKRLEEGQARLEEAQARLAEAQAQTQAELHEFRLEVRERLSRLERAWAHRDHVLMEHDRRLFELENKD